MPTSEDFASTAPAQPAPDHPPTVYRSEDYDQITRQAKVVTPPPPADTTTTSGVQTKAETTPAGDG